MTERRNLNWFTIHKPPYNLHVAVAKESGRLLEKRIIFIRFLGERVTVIELNKAAAAGARRRCGAVISRGPVFVFFPFQERGIGKQIMIRVAVPRNDVFYSFLGFCAADRKTKPL
ncbi:hypothetical protein EVAR_94126_1 [Eumeta japonica]|uniref:Uncharacterized protein n=1 Tax=Eumeta variegata TaxID=151549 RepID=A0A4C1U7L0_EUMVA|nr:hypothetical protein EVAR_94126_1 [Eumeta japonica]